MPRESVRDVTPMRIRYCHRLRTCGAVRRGSTILALGSVLFAVTACGSTAAMPDVVGMRLDVAHNELEELGIENFEDIDVIGEEDSIWRDANWVVVEQDPPAGTRDVDTDTTIKLSVGNEDDEEVLTRIPADSPFALEQSEAEREAAESAAQEAENREAQAAREEEEEAAADAEQRANDARSYATDIDEAFAEPVQGVMSLYVENAEAVHAAGGDSVVAARNAISAREFFDTALSGLNTRDVSPPASLDGAERLGDVVDRMRNALAGMVVASEALIDAVDTGAPSAFARELSARADAIEEWNQAMRDIYGAAGMEPRLVQAG
ncbi:PASTA domain-containing protein [Blastococcus brunescens]|uniref:PASTA domain-containing protein n=1 Tax=Blastococcus brunescens TaxID=1564165 RepID=A0ABZ1AXY1_9ACTN|nr:PASTA domain-containing protein [Blastococcus sp. BMG 8361]WRL63365.1 PASTA domain-containing protein [Blastococcus sp. BMG 8361]